MNKVKSFTTIRLLDTHKLDTCVVSCNTLNVLSNKACIPNKTEDLNLRVFQNDYSNK